MSFENNSAPLRHSNPGMVFPSNNFIIWKHIFRWFWLGVTKQAFWRFLFSCYTLNLKVYQMCSRTESATFVSVFSWGPHSPSGPHVLPTAPGGDAAIWPLKAILLTGEGHLPKPNNVAPHWIRSLETNQSFPQNLACYNLVVWKWAVFLFSYNQSQPNMKKTS